MQDIKINKARLADDLKALSQIGNTEHGITRTAFSDTDMAARDWLIKRIEDAGLQGSIDSAGNIIARTALDNGAPAVACGSHIDTVKCGGHLDGALGVVAGLEALRCLHENDAALAHPVEVIAFSDEEGRFGNMLGSRALTGTLPAEDIEQAEDPDGLRLVDILKERGFDPKGLQKAQRAPESFKAFLELHIEQGPVLEQQAIPVGIVNAITGLFKWQISFIGEANHAGTTPMHMRKDALLGMARFAGQIDGYLKIHGLDSTKTTIGKVDVFPGSPNVVPRQCTFTIDVRDTDQKTLDSFEQIYESALRNIANSMGLEIEINRLSNIPAVPCDKELITMLSTEAQALNLEYIIMPSGAAHDAQNMAKITPTAMIFVPSIGGISHSPLENTHINDIEKGAQLLLSALHRLARA